ncbi:hypothetical protein TNCV_5118821 [Trichonephila clavipes]|nr:hypothetical protein TNCV_5118821 [Trichonephila clavipes]
MERNVVHEEELISRSILKRRTPMHHLCEEYHTIMNTREGEGQSEKNSFAISRLVPFLYIAKVIPRFSFSQDPKMQAELQSYVKQFLSEFFMLFISENNDSQAWVDENMVKIDDLASSNC